MEARKAIWTRTRLQLIELVLRCHWIDLKDDLRHRLWELLGERFVPENELIRFPDLVNMLVAKYGLACAVDVSSLEESVQVIAAIEAELRRLGVLTGKARPKAALEGRREEMKITSLLVDGNIPARTECPYRWKCEVSEAGQCRQTGALHSCEFSCAVARGFDMTATSEELNRVPLSFEISGDDEVHGWHLVFNTEIDEGNFIEACKLAIAEARRACSAMETVAINFLAQGVNVQVVESSDAKVQFELWKRMAEAKRERSFES